MASSKEPRRERVGGRISGGSRSMSSSNRARKFKQEEKIEKTRQENLKKDLNNIGRHAEDNKRASGPEKGKIKRFTLDSIKRAVKRLGGKLTRRESRQKGSQMIRAARKGKTPQQMDKLAGRLSRTGQQEFKNFPKGESTK